MKKGLFSGTVILAIGILLLLRTMGAISFSVWQGFAEYWPAGIMLMGLALILREKGLAFIIFLLTLSAGILFISESHIIQEGEYRTLEFTAPAGPEHLNLDLDFGAGEAIIGAGDSSYLMRNSVKTADLRDPEFVDNEGSVRMSRRAEGFNFLKKNREEWDIKINPDVTADLDLDYGAADISINMTGLKVNNLDIDTGASKTEIVFGPHPTKADIDTGASKIDLWFPEGYGVLIEIDGGAVTKHLDGFAVNGKKYTSNYDPDGDNIEIEIDAGATTIDAGFIARNPG
ncbi:MAG: DUF5668 domain-containing protein [archaeon]